MNCFLSRISVFLKCNCLFGVDYLWACKFCFTYFLVIGASVDYAVIAPSVMLREDKVA